MKVLFIRGAFLNRFEGQNYEPLAKSHQIVAIGSLTSIHKKLDFPVKLFFSPYDLVSRIGRIGQIRPIGEIRGRLTKACFNRILGDSHFLFGLEKFIRGVADYCWDIGHIAETYYGYDLQAINLKKQGYIKKIISTCWETIAFNNEAIGKKKRIKEIVKKNTDLFICPTERAKKALMAEGVNEDKIGSVRMGVDLSKFKIQNSKFKIKNKEVIILFVGRLVEEKGIMDLYEAFKKVQNSIRQRADKVQNCSLKLKVIGDGYLRNTLLSLIRKDGLYGSVFIEKKSYDEMSKIYQEADVLVIPSRSTKTWEEQYGMVLVEAMASGLPMVAYRSGAVPEVLGDVGVLIKEGDINNLTKGIVTLINNDSLREKLGKMGRERAEKYFDREMIAREIEAVYEKLLNCYNAVDRT